ncbi:MAG TPA: Stp1/IreP family PP2C-type Ser/Thr phosphatase [Gaiellaceae bacterium]|jgi:protein phosphatase
MRATGLTDTGRKRRRNEDAFVCEPPLFAVADGMGGAQAGEVASQLAAAALREARDAPVDAEALVSLIQEANRRVYARSNEDPTASGMGTTMTVALVQDGHVVIGHVGDSRAYRLRDGQLEQLTEDHSLVNELMKSGRLSPEEAETHPQRSVITRALGTDPDVDVDTFVVETREGDLYLLCSDGLTTMLDDESILELIERNRTDLDRAARALVHAANRGGGEDNITVVAFEISEVEEALEKTRERVPIPAGDEDEDTLSELDAVPAVDTMVVSPEDAEKLFEAHEAVVGHEGRRGPGPAFVVVALLVVLAVAAVLVWRLAF